MPRYILPLATLLLLGGCFSPAGWTLRLEEKVECGMTVEEVQALTFRRIEELAWRNEGRLWETHVLDGFFDQGSGMNLGFEEGRLRYVEIYWGYGLMGTASYALVDLCTDEGAVSSAATESPS